MNETKIKKRASAVIVSQGKICLIKRIKPETTYFTLPGGTVEEGESFEEAMKRELKEELSISAEIDKLLFKTESPERQDYFFNIIAYTGQIMLGGPELQRMNPDNQYIIEWIEIPQLSEINFFPKEVVAIIKEQIL